MAASQIDTFKLFTALRLSRTSWAGSLLLGIGLDDAGRALALASLAAGAAALLLESDTATLREATREGCATFTVTTLDEALRALKNEVRQGRAITVALGGDAATWLREMVERGVLPQAIACTRPLTATETASTETMQAWGASRLHGLGLLGPGDIRLALPADSWHMMEDSAENMAERRAKDAALLAGSGEDDPITHHWLRAAPTLFPRALSRCYWASELSSGS